VREPLAEPARLEEIAEREANRRPGLLQDCRRLAVEAHDLLQQAQMRRPEQVAPLREEAGAPRLLYSRPVRLHDTAKHMSDGRVSRPISANSRTRFGYVRSLWTRKPYREPEAGRHESREVLGSRFRR